MTEEILFTAVLGYSGDVNYLRNNGEEIDIKDIMDKILEDLNGNLNITANNMPLENVRLKNNFNKTNSQIYFGGFYGSNSGWF